MFFLLTGLIFITLLASGVFLVTVNFFPPFLKTADSLILINLIYFFTSLWLAIAGTVSLVLYCLRTFRLQKVRSGEIEAVHRKKIFLKQSLRQGILLASGVSGIGLLHVLNFSNPLNIILLISVVVLLEVYFFGH